MTNDDGQKNDLWEALADAPHTRMRFLVAVAGPAAEMLTEEEQKNLLSHYSRDDFQMAYERGFI